MAKKGNGDDLDGDSLERLSKTARQYQALAETLDDVRSRRDMLIVACYRRGISLRRIAEAAGVHYTRVQQLARAADAAIQTAALRHPRKKRGQ